MNQSLIRDRAGRALLLASTLFLAALLAGCGMEMVGCDVKTKSSHVTASNTDARPSATQADPGGEPAGSRTASDAEPQKTAPAKKKIELTSCDGENTAEVAEELSGASLARTLMDQWRRDHPDRDWVAEEKDAHAFNPPADNSDVLEGEQGDGHAYGDFTERDLLIWRRETEKLVAEGSRIFHSADELGSTVAVSCDMCHPHASNTHPETYPKYQTQLGRAALLRDMINWCVENPVRADLLDPDGPKMRALEAYIMAQRKGVEMIYGKH
ncbi:MAG: c-type cytochrome [Planctomycetota bacterium]